MIYYHSSRSKFSKFFHKGNGKQGRGYYFASDKNEAEYYTKYLYGNGASDGRFVYTVNLKINNLFNTMSFEQAQEVASLCGITCIKPRSVGGAKEHYHKLRDKLKREGAISHQDEMNELLQRLGFDGIFYEFMNHIIVFDPQNIQIIQVEQLDSGN